METPRDHQCSHINCNVSVNLQVCTRCKASREEATYYCCTEHQKADWKIHKQICGKTIDVISTMVFTLDRMPLEYTRALRFSTNLRFCFNIAMKMVEALFAALERGMFPDDVVEGVFGIQLTPSEPYDLNGKVTLPIGNLIFHAWEDLYRFRFNGAMDGDGERALATGDQQCDQVRLSAGRLARSEKQAELAMVMLRGGLFPWFVGEVQALAAAVRKLAVRGKVRELAAAGVGKYVCELVERGFGSIRYSPNLFQLAYYGAQFTDEELAAALAGAGPGGGDGEAAAPEHEQTPEQTPEHEQPR